MDDLIRVAEFSIDRGRAYELDKVDTGRATISIHDTEGLLDPTNPGSPYTGEIQPLLQARLALWDPMQEDWFTRFRGFVESYEYEFDPSQLVNRVTISLVDLFEIVQAIQMFPGVFGDSVSDSGDVFFEDTLEGDLHGMQDRVTDILTNAPLGNCGIPAGFYVVFSGNVSLHEATYSAGESAMTAIQDAVEAEFPAVGNVACDRLGRLTVHGRYARFDPVGTAAATVGWDFRDWKAGDGAAVAASPTDTAHIRSFSISRDLGKIINFATASPKTNLTGAAYDTAIQGQLVQDADSKRDYGIRGWSAENLLTKEGVTDGDLGDGGDWLQTKRFASYYKNNFKTPQNRVTRIGFRSSSLDMTGSAANWEFLTACDLNDRIALTISSPGGGGFEDEQYFIEGIHEEVRPLSGEMDDVTLTLDLSPFDYFLDNPFSEP